MFVALALRVMIGKKCSLKLTPAIAMIAKARDDASLTLVICALTPALHFWLQHPPFEQPL